MDPDEFIILLLMELVGALTGAFFGVKWGYTRAASHERKMRKEENKEEKGEYINAIINEIKFNIDVLNKDLKEIEIEGNVIKTITQSYFTFSFDSGINSGKYSSLSSQIQIEMAILYGAFYKLNEMRNYHKKGRTSEDLKNTSATIESLCTNLKRRLPITVKLLEKE